MTASNQKYLKAIYVLSQQNESIRVMDIAAALLVTKASVCNGLKKLADKGYVAHELYGDVRLTAEGRKKAEALLASYGRMMQYIGEGTRLPAGFEYLLDGAIPWKEKYADALM